MTLQPARACPPQGRLFLTSASSAQPIWHRRPFIKEPSRGALTGLALVSLALLAGLVLTGCTTPGAADPATKDSPARDGPAAAPAAAGGTGTSSKSPAAPSVGTGSPPSSAASAPAKAAAPGAAARPPDKPASSPGAPADSLARTAQELLNALGFGPLTMDGYWGPQSRRALQTFLTERKDKSPPLPTEKNVDLLREAARAAKLPAAGGRRVP